MPVDDDTPLGRRIRDMIRLDGPMRLDRFMALCLGDPLHGYYTTRDPFGSAGDFITAPEISQMFGELIGLWAAETWNLMGQPRQIALVELGPGRGTLMADAWRAAKILPAFTDAASIHLVETSPVLAEKQRATLKDAPAQWHEAIETLPDGPAIIIANEFFDALPVRQFVAQGGRWHERLIGLTADDALAFGLATEADPAMGTTSAEDATVREAAFAGWAIADSLARRLASSGGALLAIDYGYADTKPAAGDTLQALRGHQMVDPLSRPGEQDLTTHVDFAALARVAIEAGCAVHGPVTQAAFLNALGLPQRAAALMRRADTEGAARIEAARNRLTEHGPTGMGDLFKVIAIADPQLPLLPGFDRLARP